MKLRPSILSLFPVLAVLVAACASDGPRLRTNAQIPTLSTETDWSAFPLGSSDIVHVGVYGHPDLGTGGTRIDAEGNLSLPLVGAVHVAGMSVSEASAAITAAYSKFVIDPKVDVSVTNHSARRFYVLGEVAKPGSIEIDRPVNVLQALALAGGFTGKADQTQVVLMRGAPESLEVAVIDAENPDNKAFLAMRSEDLLFVRRTHAGKFSDEILPYLVGISSSLSSAATILLIDDKVNNN